MADWPLISDLGPLGALPTAPRLARGFTGVVLIQWGLPGLTEVAELLVTELTSNVVRASTGSDGSPRYDAAGRLPLVWVRLLSDRTRLLLEVWDNLPETLGAPVQRHAEPADESGRGLEMVDTLSEQWGWETVPGWSGKRVWALLTAPGGLPEGLLAPQARIRFALILVPREGGTPAAILPGAARACSR